MYDSGHWSMNKVFWKVYEFTVNIPTLLDILLSRLTRVVADSGAGSTIETFRNSELISAIFNNFALKFNERTSIKVLEYDCENKASI